jgi:mannose-6-phosphate isomerase-like protein (cupin superfamily)
MRLDGLVEKGWGNETIFATNELYCGKILTFNEKAKFSMHFHIDKDETWYVLDGIFRLIYIDTENASEKNIILKPGDTWRNKPLLPHQLECLSAGRIIEVSTPDSVEDNYRIRPGDSQKT